MPIPPGGTERRKSPRIDVLRRVQGHLIELDTPIIIHDLSRSGFAVVSELTFEPGQTLAFVLSYEEDGSTLSVTAEAVHSRPVFGTENLMLTGFQFVPGHLTGLVPQAKIDQLIAAVTTPKIQFFQTAG